MERLTQIQQVNQSIMFGNFTNIELDAIVDAVKFARAQIANQNKREMRIGTHYWYCEKGKQKVYPSYRNQQALYLESAR